MRSFALAADLTVGQARLESLVRAADSALAAGRSDRALDYVLPVLADDSLDGELWCEAHLTAATAHLWAGDPNATKGDVGAVIERFPDPAEAEMPHVIRAL